MVRNYKNVGRNFKGAGKFPLKWLCSVEFLIKGRVKGFHCTEDMEGFYMKLQ